MFVLEAILITCLKILGPTMLPPTIPEVAETSNIGGIVGGMVASFVLSTVMAVVIALLSVWLFNR